MDITAFGKQLFEIGDLDPIYLTLIGANLDRNQLARWLVAYWMFYHAGFACYASEHERDDFWKVLARAAGNADASPCGGRWPRGAERRHFRGEAAIKAVACLRRRYPRPETMVDYIATGALDVRSVIGRAKDHPMFGDWIGFKAADMIDAVVGVSVLQDDLSVFLYQTPRRSMRETLPDASAEQAMAWLGEQLRTCKIPHKPANTPDLFSLETVWCKHLSHRHGHYPLGKDIREIRHGIAPWTTVCATARKFLSFMRTVNDVADGV